MKYIYNIIQCYRLISADKKFKITESILWRLVFIVHLHRKVVLFGLNWGVQDNAPSRRLGCLFEGILHHTHRVPLPTVDIDHWRNCVDFPPHVQDIPLCFLDDVVVLADAVHQILQLLQFHQIVSFVDRLVFRQLIFLRLQFLESLQVLLFGDVVVLFSVLVHPCL